MLWLKDYLDKCPSAYEELVGGYIISDRFLCLTNRLDSVVNGIGESDYYAVYNLKTGKQKTSQYLTGHGLSADRQKQKLNLIGEWELVEWSVQWRGYGYDQDWCEQDDFYIGRKVEIRPDGTAIYG